MRYATDEELLDMAEALREGRFVSGDFVITDRQLQRVYELVTEDADDELAV